MLEKIKARLAGLKTAEGGPGLPGLPAWRSLMPLVALAVVVTLLVMVWVWRDESRYRPVFGAREKVAMADMMAVFDAEHIPYRLHPETGQVLVPENQLGKVRMLLAAKGITAQLPAGLELLDHNDPLGVSQFVQDVRFRRGLEGELAQSIMTLDPVESARVHLSIARSTSFVVSDGEKSSASVVIALKSGNHLNPEQSAAIVKLVAGSVSTLDPQRVTLVDQAGNLLSAQLDLTEGAAASASDSQASRRYRDEAKINAAELLAPVLGGDNFKVSVTAEVDNDRVEETREKYGEAPKITNEAMREEQARDGQALGVPGSLSNRPATPADASSPAADNGVSNKKNAMTRQYAYDRSVLQIKRARGSLRSLHVAVLVNAAMAPDRKTGWTPEQLGHFDRLLRNGLGINAARGDTLVVTAMAFPGRAAAEPWWMDRGLWFDAAGYLAWALGLLIGWFVVARPLLRWIKPWLPRPPAPPGRAAPDVRLAMPAASALAADGSAEIPRGLAAKTAAKAEPRSAGLSAAPVVPLLDGYDLPPAGSSVDVLVEHLKMLASKEPERVAEVVKQWVQSHGRSA
ncbi:flagellar basal-body MS-ring/collar protein FliF [Paludibacterium paludis]|uniref:Flagellar M-ring protein n=1 Tax=Paludibacterium paludis TaxID=1225769 RepID=A0A918U796_9NEIS|nr:flagellar basal-body MS-ring/collar protein FliF [Paludibacterium paludis]GGY04595.1 flagellar M-ring protein [Paludibacterium paludis]